MRLRIVRPPPPEIEGLQVGHLRFGASYEIAQPLSELLLLMGYAVPVDDPPIRAGVMTRKAPKPRQRKTR